MKCWNFYCFIKLPPNVEANMTVGLCTKSGGKYSLISLCLCFYADRICLLARGISTVGFD